MATIALWVLLAQAPACPPDAASLMAEGARLASELNLAAAAGRYAQADSHGCEDARIVALYLQGLAVARAAYAAGGSAESLEPVRRAEAALGTLSTGPRSVAEIARFLLMAAASAAQSERYEMGTLLTHATGLEALRLLAGESAVPGVSAHELAGDLWLQVHRFEDARTAYRQAVEHVGPTARISLGLARTAVRLGDVPDACEAYTSLLRFWTGPADQPDVVAAREFIAERCR